LLGLFGGGIGAFCFGPVKKILIEAVGGSDILPDEPPGLGDISAVAEGEDLHFFLESATILPGGIILSGQIEAGRIERAGQHVADWARLTDAEDIRRFRYDPAGATVSYPAASAMVRTLFSFEQLGIDDIEALTESVHANEVSLSVADLGNRLVFALRLEGNRCAKVRIDPQPEGDPHIRWVTYQPKRMPTAAISGEWRNEISDRIPNRASVSGATRYWGEFRVETDGIYTDEYLQSYPLYEWSIEPAYGRIEANGAQCALEIITDTDLPDDYRHRISLRVTTTDVFGRTASTAVVLEAERLSWSTHSPRRIRDPEVIRIRPEEPMPAEKERGPKYEGARTKLTDAAEAIYAAYDAISAYAESQIDEESEHEIEMNVETRHH
jgi:hypothetical protein